MHYPFLLGDDVSYRWRCDLPLNQKCEKPVTAHGPNWEHFASGHTDDEPVAVVNFMPHPRRVEKHVTLVYLGSTR